MFFIKFMDALIIFCGVMLTIIGSIKVFLGGDTNVIIGMLYLIMANFVFNDWRR